MNQLKRRVVVTTADVRQLTGYCACTASRLLTKIRKHFGKPMRSHVYVKEYCAYMSLDEDFMMNYIN